MISDTIKYIGVDDLDIDLFESQYVVPEDLWDQVIAEAQQFSANVCQSINNSVDLTFADKKKQELKNCEYD